MIRENTATLGCCLNSGAVKMKGYPNCNFCFIENKRKAEYVNL
jgi:hypothetical protein